MLPDALDSFDVLVGCVRLEATLGRGIRDVSSPDKSAAEGEALMDGTGGSFDSNRSSM